MFSIAKKVTSAVMAGAVVLGTLAVYPIINQGKNVVNAETLYDSASLVNYQTIMGRAVDYGIVSKSLIQSMHMETTFATSSFSRPFPCNDSIDIDLTASPTAQFIIGDITTDQISFGPVKHTDDAIDVENINIVFPSEQKDTIQSKVDYRLNVQNDTTFNYSYLPKSKIDENINSIIGHAGDESNKIIAKTSKT